MGNGGRYRWHVRREHLAMASRFRQQIQTIIRCEVPSEEFN